MKSKQGRNKQGRNKQGKTLKAALTLVDYWTTPEEQADT